MNVTIYHNPNCGTSRNALAAIRAAGHEPRMVEYLKTPPTRVELKNLIARMKLSVRDSAQEGAILRELLGRARCLRRRAVDAMIENPILIDRPIVVTQRAARLCRPSELVKELLAASR